MYKLFLTFLFTCGNLDRVIPDQPSWSVTVVITIQIFKVDWIAWMGGGELRYQPGLKKVNFLNFLISRRSDKAFQELSFKKNSTKKYSFSAKLLDVKVYYTLIVLITRWQVLSFWSNLSQNKSQGIVVPFYMPQDWFKCLRKKRRVVPVFVCNGQAEEAEKIVKLGIGLKT